MDMQMLSTIWVMYAHGRVVEQDDSKAMRWLAQAADQGCREAQPRIDEFLANRKKRSPNSSKGGVVAQAGKPREVEVAN